MNTNSATSIAGSASSAARALAASLPAAGQELADGALRLSAGLSEARERLDGGRTRLTDALEAAVAATRSGLRDYRNQAAQQAEGAADRVQGLRAAATARARDGLAYSAELGGRAAAQLQGIGARMLKSAARHPYAAVGIVAAACYLIVRRMTRRRAGAKAPAAKKRARRPRSGATSVRTKESRAGNGSASA